MAAIGEAAWVAVRGYEPLGFKFGWQDFDFRCKLTDNSRGAYRCLGYLFTAELKRLPAWLYPGQPAGD